MLNHSFNSARLHVVAIHIPPEGGASALCVNGTFEAALTGEPVIDGEFWLICGQRRELSEMKNDSWFAAAGIMDQHQGGEGKEEERKRSGRKMRKGAFGINLLQLSSNGMQRSEM